MSTKYISTGLKMLWITLVLFIVGEAAAHLMSTDTNCLYLDAVSKFDQHRFLGTWYVAERYSSKFEDGSKCVTVNYTSATDGSVQIIHTQTSLSTKKTSSIKGIARPIVNIDDAQWIVRFPSLFDISGRYSILGTDYDNWAVLSYCRITGSFSFTSAWIYMRSRNPKGKALDDAYKVADKIKISRKQFTKIDQENCPKS